jgi:hypothetical protein
MTFSPTVNFMIGGEAGIVKFCLDFGLLAWEKTNRVPISNVFSVDRSPGTQPVDAL